MTERLLPALEPGMLVLADRRFFSYALWRKVVATGADLAWRVRTDEFGPKPHRVQDLPGGSWLAHLRPAHDKTSGPAEGITAECCGDPTDSAAARRRAAQARNGDGRRRVQDGAAR
ncbi:hypothetical protein FGL98_23975 [Leekyejoonella antrihumi]|uniref:Transposase n=1 Tax=Leekyejoonella antrihumi TaxID=1660198 RepID=A0A563DRG3_9MICO|nr:hypothetical protein FGL98_23975 [Leekyejoonella antrihumi]